MAWLGSAFFPGSTIGNLLVSDAVDLLRAMAATLGADSMLLIGIDRIKDADILVPAYDDAQGVTAAFNLNLLHRINRELSGTVPVDAFSHVARWNDGEARIEMHLKAARDVHFSVDGRLFSMASGETIHTENSFKYDPRDACVLLRAGGWTPIADWTDEKEFFSLILAKVATAASAPNHVNRRADLRVMERHDGDGEDPHDRYRLSLARTRNRGEMDHDGFTVRWCRMDRHRDHPEPDRGWGILHAVGISQAVQRRAPPYHSSMNSRRSAFMQWASINGGCRSVEFAAGGAVLIGLLAPLAALGLLVIILVAIATSGRQRIKLYKPIDEADRIDDWLYLPETLYAFMLIIVVSAGAGPYSLDALILGLMNKHVA